MELWEIRKYGFDYFGDPDYVHLYGMPPAEWYRRGIRLLARTTVECVRDSLGDLIGQEILRVLLSLPASATRTPLVVLDPFAGSGNSLYWILQHLREASGLAFEVDPIIYDTTRRNIASLQMPIELLHGDFRALLPALRLSPAHRLVVFISPPWGTALNPVSGLDLRRTQPPVPEVIEFIDGLFSDIPILYATQVRQPLDTGSLAELAWQFDWSELHIYDINSEGMKPGVLLGSRRWIGRGARE
jgi:16S rRNA G966 N2-methylase RsmD